MEDIKKQLFELAEKRDSDKITDKGYIMSFCNVLQNNNASINTAQVDYLVDVILNDRVFEDMGDIIIPNT